MNIALVEELRSRVVNQMVNVVKWAKVSRDLFGDCIDVVTPCECAVYGV